MLETLQYLKHETSVWFELTTLLIPGENDSDAELDALTRWVVEELGPDVPLHFSAFHPDSPHARPAADAPRDAPPGPGDRPAATACGTPTWATSTTPRPTAPAATSAASS